MKNQDFQKFRFIIIVPLLIIYWYLLTRYLLIPCMYLMEKKAICYCIWITHSERSSKTKIPRSISRSSNYNLCHFSVSEMTPVGLNSALIACVVGFTTFTIFAIVTGNILEIEYYHEKDEQKSRSGIRIGREKRNS